MCLIYITIVSVIFFTVCAHANILYYICSYLCKIEWCNVLLIRFAYISCIHFVLIKSILFNRCFVIGYVHHSIMHVLKLNDCHNTKHGIYQRRSHSFMSLLMARGIVITNKYVIFTTSA